MSVVETITHTVDLRLDNADGGKKKVKKQEVEKNNHSWAANVPTRIEKTDLIQGDSEEDKD